jgi:hypothetical protein
MPPAGFELAILAIEHPQTHVFDRVATGIGSQQLLHIFALRTKVYFNEKFIERDLTCHIHTKGRTQRILVGAPQGSDNA